MTKELSIVTTEEALQKLEEIGLTREEALELTLPELADRLDKGTKK